MRNILITGVSRGLGRALADFYIAAGHRVFGCARSESAILDLQTIYPEHHFSVAPAGRKKFLARIAYLTC